MSKSQPVTKVDGFTLIELLIAIAIIGVLAAVIIPSYKGSVRKANEAAAVVALNTIKVAETKFAGDHKEQYGTFRELFAEGYLDKRFNFDQPALRGYIFTLTLTPKSAGKAATFSLNANPEVSQGLGATGKMFYYTDPDNGICFNRDAPATAADEAL